MVKNISADFKNLTLHYDCTPKNTFGGINIEDVEELMRMCICMFKIESHSRILEKIEHAYALQIVCNIRRCRGTLDIRHVKGYISSLNKQYEKVDKINSIVA